MALQVRVLQQCRERFRGTATLVVLPAEGGQMTVLAHHAPLVCVLERGEVMVDGTIVPVRGGVARFARNVMTIVAD